jgi:hypothetical protein
MSVAEHFAAKLGAYIKERIRAGNYRHFVQLLGSSPYGTETGTGFVASLPVTMYNGFFSAPKTYAVVLTNGFYLDLNPSGTPNPQRIAALNQNTIQSLELIQPRIWDKVNIRSCDDDFVRVSFTTQSGNTLSLRLFSDVPGEKSLTMDAYETSRIYRFLKEVKETSKIDPANYGLVPG